MSNMAVTHRDGMDFCGDKVDVVLGLGGRTLEAARQFCWLMWEGPQRGDFAILKEGLYYVCDGIDPDTGKPFTADQMAEITNHFDEGAVIFL